MPVKHTLEDSSDTEAGLHALLLRDGPLILEIKAIPRATNTELCGFQPDGALKIRIAAPADKGKANAELCRFLATIFGVRREHVQILSGVTSARKRIRIIR